ncbi:tRNA threonylcarbamoyladenosine dehydratase [Clostridium sp. MCC353]|uniref:tRNA threonylcarbamoyladenosine dehydratase n=1 Tax=Clostridium sp. MCC353 TaxID=2592646 RepID=UPI001C013325|nr:tRNA threonylcarbamoyladenosine dehydratase [Clostridium sp. MCC353]MBT9779118.1 tRNA threonylcarbamoyladenosine dehydratase [Clostridium sp. MCC353]
MIHPFSRTELLIGSDNLNTLSACTIAVFGVGGVGSHCIEALARSGIGRLILVDNDTVSLTNINRQSIAVHSTVGKHKTQVMKDRIQDINPDCQVITFEAFVLPDNLSSLLDGIDGPIDYIIDAIDTVSAKIALAQYALSREIPIIASMGTGNKLHGELFEIADLSATSICPLCRVMRRELKKRGIEHLKVLYSKEMPLKPMAETEEETSKRATPGSISFVPPVAGLLIAGEVIRDIIDFRGIGG